MSGSAYFAVQVLEICFDSDICRKLSELMKQGKPDNRIDDRHGALLQNGRNSTNWPPKFMKNHRVECQVVRPAKIARASDQREIFGQ